MKATKSFLGGQKVARRRRTTPGAGLASAFSAIAALSSSGVRESRGALTSFLLPRLSLRSLPFKNIRYPLVVLAGVFLFLLAVGLLRSASFFDLQGVVVCFNGACGDHGEKVTKAGLDKIFALLPSQSIYSADYSEIEAALGAEPGIHHATIKRIFPNRVQINIVEERPKALLRIAEGLFYLNAEGMPYRPIDASLRNDFPLIGGCAEENGRENCVARAFDVLDLLEKNGLIADVSELVIAGERIRMTMATAPFRVDFGKAVSETQLQRLSYIRSYVQRHHIAIKGVDLTHPQKAVALTHSVL